MAKQSKGTGHIRLKGIFCTKANLEQKLAMKGPRERGGDVEPASPLAFSVGLTAWARAEGEVRVELSVTVKPDEESRQPYLVEVGYIGDFELHLDQLPEGLDRRTFAEQNAAAILFPYVRETVTSLTARGISGPLFLPPVNVVAMLQREKEENQEAVPSQG